jgi:hypothetical protein
MASKINNGNINNGINNASAGINNVSIINNGISVMWQRNGVMA